MASAGSYGRGRSTGARRALRNLNELDVQIQRVIDGTVGLGGLEIFQSSLPMKLRLSQVMASRLKLDVVSKSLWEGGSTSLSGGRVAEDGREN